MKKLQTHLTNIQILSALIWAAVIIACSYAPDKSDVSTILIAAAGIHVILMARMKNKNSEGQIITK